MPASWTKGLKDDFRHLFVQEWSPYLAALVLVGIVIALMVNGLFWGVYGGLRLWGNWFNELIGLNALLGARPRLDNVLLHRISLMNITLLIGAFSAALLSGQFRVNRAPKLEYLWGAMGGTLMGIGATLAGGCTVGGFFTPLVFSSPAGWAMGAGLVIGAWIGLKLLLWTLENIQWGSPAPGPLLAAPGAVRIFPLVGAAVLGMVLLWTVSWYVSGEKTLESRAILVVCGFALGFTLHRSRFCFARVVREPMMTGDGTLTKAMILAIAVGVPMASLLFQKDLIDPFLAIPATFWMGSLLGGIVFGIGMIFAGGCASGSLWRMGEGHLKLWVAGFFFAWGGATFSAILSKWEVMKSEMNLDLVEETKVGIQTHLPAMTGGWGTTYAITAGILLLWYVAVRYNESTQRFTVT
jgi:uncharacterized membrane protein YedE/YeeE